METPEQAAARRAENARPGGAATGQIDREEGVGGAAGVSEASLGAFREMAAASLALNRPDILYALMFLSLSHPFWFFEENKLQYRFVSVLRAFAHLTQLCLVRLY